MTDNIDTEVFRERAKLRDLRIQHRDLDSIQRARGVKPDGRWRQEHQGCDTRIMRDGDAFCRAIRPGIRQGARLATGKGQRRVGTQ